MLSQDEREYQEEIRKLQDMDLRCMRKPSRMTQIAECVPMPCNPMPDDALPRWSNLPLNHKLPIIPCAEGQFRLSRNRVGRSLFQCKPCKIFDTNDPYIRRTPINYDPLHDPNLNNYFKKHPRVMKNLAQQGLVSETGKVDCSIHDFNKYRDYLSRIHSKCINNERDRQDMISESDMQQIKKIKQYLNKEDNARKTEETEARRCEFKTAATRRNLMAQIKELEHPSVTYKQRLSIIRNYQMKRREYLRQQKRARIEQMQLAVLEKNRTLVLEWYCKDLYSDKIRKSVMEYKKATRNNERECFVKCKREFQEQKLRYERAILLRHTIERHSAILQRKEHYTQLEINRVVNVKKRAERKQKKADRVMYLMRKYGKKWLAFVAAKKKEVSLFHDSLWHVRQQLREMVGVLREESGAVSFSSFIQGLVGLKPGKNSIKMSDETRDVINFILSCLMDNVFKEFIRKSTTCALDFFSEETRKKMGRFNCNIGEIIPIEDFIPPATRRCFRPQLPYERPPWPCTGPCADFKVFDISDLEWKNRCEEMAKCLTDVHNAISKQPFPKARCEALMNEILQEQNRKWDRKKRKSLERKQKALNAKHGQQKTLESVGKEVHKNKFKCPFKCGSEGVSASVDQLIATANASYQSKLGSKIREQRVPNQRGQVSQIPNERSKPTFSKHKPDESIEETWQQKCSKMSQCLSDVHLSISNQPYRSSSDESLVEKVIKQQLTKLQNEKNVVGKGSEAAIEELVDEENMSRMSSAIVDKSICSQAKLLGPCSVGTSLSQESPQSVGLATGHKVDQPKTEPKTANKSFEVLKPEQSKPKQPSIQVEPTEEASIDALVDNETISRISSAIVEQAICDQAKLLDPCVDKASLGNPEQSKSKQSNTQDEQAEEAAIAALVDDETISRISSVIVKQAICDQAKLIDPCADKASLGTAQSESVLDTSLSSTASSNVGMVDRIISDQRRSLESARPCTSSNFSMIDEIIDDQLKQLEEENARKCKELKQALLTDPDSSFSLEEAPTSADESFVDDIILEQLKKLQHEKDVIGGGDETAIDALANDENMSRISSGIVKKVICEQVRLLDPCYNQELSFGYYQPNMAEGGRTSVDNQYKQVKAEKPGGENHLESSQPRTDIPLQQRDTPYLDPTEQGISPVRSEIRLHLNLIRQELDNLKNQLTRQGIIKPPTPPDS